MDEFVIRFMNELGTNLFLAKNVFFFVETLVKGLSHLKTGSMSQVSMVTWLAFWNGIVQYFFGLYGKNSDRSFPALFRHLDAHPELIPTEKRSYYQSISTRAQLRRQPASISRYEMDTLFDDIVYANEIYVNICNLFEIPRGSQHLHLTDKYETVQ